MNNLSHKYFYKKKIILEIVNKFIDSYFANYFDNLPYYVVFTDSEISNNFHYLIFYYRILNLNKTNYQSFKKTLKKIKPKIVHQINVVLQTAHKTDVAFLLDSSEDDADNLENKLQRI